MISMRENARIAFVTRIARGSVSAMKLAWANSLMNEW